MAAAKYEEAAQLDRQRSECEWCPAIYFYLGNSYDNMYRPARKGEPANDELLHEGRRELQAREREADRRDEPKRSLALEFLVAAYGPDKLDDPTQAEPVVQQHDSAGAERADQLLPAREDLRGLGRVQLAEETYLKGRDAKPNDPTVYLHARRLSTTARATSTS